MVEGTRKYQFAPSQELGKRAAASLWPTSSRANHAYLFCLSSMQPHTQELDKRASSSLWPPSTRASSLPGLQHTVLDVREDESGRPCTCSGERSQERTPECSRHPTPKKGVVKRSTSCSDNDDEVADEGTAQSGMEQNRMKQRAHT